MNQEPLKDLSPAARTEVGRAYNAMIQMENAEREMILARTAYMTLLIKCRAVHGVTIDTLAAALGKSKEHVARKTASYTDPKFKGTRAASDRPAYTKGNQKKRARVRGRDQIAGARPAPEELPSYRRIARSGRSGP